MSQDAAERAHDKIDKLAIRVGDIAVQNGSNTVRISVLINGGAAVAILAFLGSLGTNSFSKYVEALEGGLFLFSLGVAVATFSLAFSYVANCSSTFYLMTLQRNFDAPYISAVRYSKLWKVSGIIFSTLAVFTALASLVCFLIGIWEIKDAIVELKSKLL
jgi:hypothetical protein